MKTNKTLKSIKDLPLNKQKEIMSEIDQIRKENNLKLIKKYEQVTVREALVRIYGITDDIIQAKIGNKPLGTTYNIRILGRIISALYDEEQPHILSGSIGANTYPLHWIKQKLKNILGA